MERDHVKVLADSMKRLMRRGGITHLRKMVNNAHASDLASVFRSMSFSSQKKLLDLVEDIDGKSALFAELDTDILNALVEGMEVDDVATILEKMPADDAADLIGKLPEKKSAALLKAINWEGSEDVEGLLKYKDDTAGGIMVTDFISLKEETTAKEAIASLQNEHMDVEMPFYLYVVDDYGKLVGVCSLRQLVTVPPATPLRSFMATDVFKVKTYTDQEKVAKIVSNYDILAVPVVDDENVMAGIVTVDDVIDIIRAEATEDILKMAGAGEEFVETKSVIKSTKIRLPWLFASCLGGIMAFFIIGRFEETLQQVTSLAAFIPVIMGMGGNIGTQSSTIVVRGLATGRLQIDDLWNVVLKELAIGLILGFVYGALIGIVAQFNYSTPALAFAVGLAVISSMSVAALVGSMVPMFFGRIGVDPAVATGPFVTTAIDIISVFVYFMLATVFLGL